MAVSLRVRKVGEEWTSGQEGSDVARSLMFPKGRGRKELKLIALIQTFADTASHEGYVVEKIDMKPTGGVQAVEGKKWEIRVELRQG